jgi:hypothetical protein
MRSQQRQAVTHIRECRSDSNRCIPYRKKPDQHVVRLASQVSLMTIVRKFPTNLNLGPCSRDEVLATSDGSARPSSWAASFSLQ